MIANPSSSMSAKNLPDPAKNINEAKIPSFEAAGIRFANSHRQFREEHSESAAILFATKRNRFAYPSTASSPVGVSVHQTCSLRAMLAETQQQAENRN